MTIVEIRTTRYNDESNSHMSHFRDYTIRENDNGSVDLQIVTKTVDHKEIKCNLQDIIKMETKTYSSAKRCVGDFLIDMKDDQDFTYCEIEIKCFIRKRRHDKEFKMTLHTQKSYDNIKEVEQFLDLIMSKDAILDSIAYNKTNSDEVNETQKDMISELLNTGIDKIQAKMNEKFDNLQEVAVEKAISVVQDQLSDTISSVSSNSRKKRKSFLGIFRR